MGEKTMKRFTAFLGVLYVVTSVLQCVALIAAVDVWLGVPAIIAIPLSMILAAVPLVGSVLGFIGATEIWQWNVWFSAALFLSFPLLFAGEWAYWQVVCYWEEWRGGKKQGR